MTTRNIYLLHLEKMRISSPCAFFFTVHLETMEKSRVSVKGGLFTPCHWLMPVFKWEAAFCREHMAGRAWQRAGGGGGLLVVGGPSCPTPPGVGVSAPPSRHGFGLVPLLELAHLTFGERCPHSLKPEETCSSLQQLSKLRGPVWTWGG